MKAPDKIYIQTNAGEAFSSKWTTIPFRNFENTEYIRKDALIDWLSKCKNNPTITDLQKDNIQELIDKIDSI